MFRLSIVDVHMDLILNGIPDWARTSDLQLRRLSHYPTVLRGCVNKFTDRSGGHGWNRTTNGPKATDLQSVRTP